MTSNNAREEAVPPRVLTIAGSDSGGGAGIEADFKTFTALGCYGMAAITSVTAQNTVAVTSIHDLPPAEVAKQIDAVLEDIGADTAKTGMLSNEGIIEAVAASLEGHPIERLVVDPVMIAKSGDALLQESARRALIERILPLSFIVTPNVPEAETLAGMAIDTEEAMREAASRIHALGPRYVLMKGGHLEGEEVIDYLFDGSAMHAFRARRIETGNTHGTGCTFSAAIAAYLAKGAKPVDAVRMAKEYVTGAIQHSFSLGAGHGPLHHMWAFPPGKPSS